MQILNKSFLSNKFLPIVLIVLVRVLFIAIFPSSSFDFMLMDSREYVQLADRVLAGKFNFDIGRFVRSPLYSFMIAGHKIIFAAYWEKALILSQIVLSVFTGIFICKISRLVFKNEAIVQLTGFMYAIYLPVFYYVYSFTSETLYMFLNVGSMYFFLKVLGNASIKNVLSYALFFSLTYLTRGEILLFMPLAFLIIFWTYKREKKKVAGIYAGIILTWFLVTLPWGLVNVYYHDEYLTSSNGGKYVFYLSNSPLGYAEVVDIPHLGTAGDRALRLDYNYFNLDYDSIINLPPHVKQKAFFKSSINWVKQNPYKFLEIKFWNAVNFFSPGLTIAHHPMKTWILMFIVTLPFHLLFFVGLFLAVRASSITKHFWIMGYFLSMLGFLVLFLYTARFRAYSVEVYYLIYAAYAVAYLLRKTRLNVWLSPPAKV